MDFNALCQLMARYRSVTQEKIKNQQLSGAIYSKGVIEAFRKAVEESMQELERLNTEKKLNRSEFPGEASLYGEIGAALHPQRGGMKASKYVENYLLGRRGAKDAIRNYFLAGANPHLKV